MKNILFLIAILFTVICYAAPPPEVKTYAPEKVVLAEADNCFAVLQTAYVLTDIANTELSAQNQKIKMADLPQHNFELVREVTRKPKDSDLVVVNSADSQILIAEKTTFYTINQIHGVAVNLKCPLTYRGSKDNLKANTYAFEINHQNSNYGYPLSAN